MAIDAKQVAELREMTGAGMMDAKKALEEANGDLVQATENLRKRGAAKAAKKSDRVTSEGRVHSYVHATGKIGVLVEVQCETDFVARNEDFISFCNDIALHIAANDPTYMRREDFPQEVSDKEKELFIAELKESGKPEEIIDKIVEGKMDKFYSENCLLEQAFVKDDSKTMNQLVEEHILAIGENIQISRFCRFQIG
ncbi:MAG: translation elongation factor Ts [bacterium]|nr:translation elongation factor Ts [bacterium]